MYPFINPSSLSFFLCFFFSIVVCSLHDRCSLTKDWTCTLAVKAQSPKHWTTKEVPFLSVYTFPSKFPMSVHCPVNILTSLSWTNIINYLCLLFFFLDVKPHSEMHESWVYDCWILTAAYTYYSKPSRYRISPPAQKVLVPQPLPSWAATSLFSPTGDEFCLV